MRDVISANHRIIWNRLHVISGSLLFCSHLTPKLLCSWLSVVAELVPIFEVTIKKATRLQVQCTRSQQVWLCCSLQSLFDCIVIFELLKSDTLPETEQHGFKETVVVEVKGHCVPADGVLSAHRSGVYVHQWPWAVSVDQTEVWDSRRDAVHSGGEEDTAGPHDPLHQVRTSFLCSFSNRPSTLTRALGSIT